MLTKISFVSLYIHRQTAVTTKHQKGVTLSFFEGKKKIHTAPAEQLSRKPVSSLRLIYDI